MKVNPNPICSVQTNFCQRSRFLSHPLSLFLRKNISYRRTSSFSAVRSAVARLPFTLVITGVDGMERYACMGVITVVGTFSLGVVIPRR